MAGLLDAARQWMTPERAIAMQGIGMGLSQLGAGQPVNMSPAYDALQQRKQQAQLKSLMEQPGMLDRFSPQQKAALAAMPESLATKILMESIFAPPPEPTKGIVVGDNLVNPITGQTIYQGQSKPTDDMREYEMARSQGYAGTFTDYMTEMRRAGATTVNVGPSGIDYGQPPTDMVWLRNPDGTVRLDQRGAPMAAVVSGSKSDMDRVKYITEMAGSAIREAERQGAASSADATASQIVTDAAARAREAAQNRNAGAAGTTIVGQLPWTDSAEVLRQTNVLKSMASIENLNAMRAESKTGGALGNVTERELQILQDKSGALDPNSPNFLRDLDDYERTILRTIHGKEAGDRIFEQTRGIDAASSARADTTTTQGAENDPLGLFK